MNCTQHYFTKLLAGGCDEANSLLTKQLSGSITFFGGLLVVVLVTLLLTTIISAIFKFKKLRKILTTLVFISLIGFFAVSIYLLHLQEITPDHTIWNVTDHARYLEQALSPISSVISLGLIAILYYIIAIFFEKRIKSKKRNRKNWY